MSERTSEQIFPDDWEDAGDSLMSNFDHEVNEEIAEKLCSGPYVASYPGWNFHAVCWFRDGKYHARVKTYGVVRGIYSVETPKKLMAAVSSEYGYD